MPYFVIALVALTVPPALVGGCRNLTRWDSGGDPNAFRSAVGQATVASLRFGLMLLMLAVAAIAVVSAIAALKGSVALPHGGIVCAVVALLLAALVYRTFGRRVRTVHSRR